MLRKSILQRREEGNVWLVCLSRVQLIEGIYSAWGDDMYANVTVLKQRWH